MRSFILILLVCLSAASYAEFDLQGTGYLQHSQQKIPFNFGLSLLRQNDGYLFQVGAQQLQVDTVPRRFTLALIQNKQQQVWVKDFSTEPLDGFEWQIGPHSLRLSKAKTSGKMQLTIDRTVYEFTDKQRGQIHFFLTEQGILDIRVESMMQVKR